MSQWYVKELSRLTQVSVQTLHHYDRIGLLEPSVRLANGYRLYSEKDLLTLQQIIALKYFGFELAQIKEFLAAHVNVLERLSQQATVLDEKAKSLIAASNALNRIVSECNVDKSIPWEKIIELIEVYRMTQALEKTWEGKALNPDELKEYANFERDLKTRFTASEQKKCENDWHDIVTLVNASVENDPTSEASIALAKRTMDWVNNLYGKEYIGLRNAIWEKGFKEGHAAPEHNMSAESVAWLDQAMEAYYRSRIYKILDQVGDQQDLQLQNAWKEVLFDMYGNDQKQIAELIEAVMSDDRISKKAKEWVRNIGCDSSKNA